jgi:replicative DNA helicase
MHGIIEKIEVLSLQYIITKQKQYLSLLKHLDIVFYTKPIYKNILKFLKTTPESDWIGGLQHLNLNSNQLSFLTTYKNNKLTAESILSIIFNNYKKREIDLTVSALNKETDLSKKQELIKKLSHINNLSITATFKKTEEALKEYDDYIAQKQEEFINGNGQVGISTGIEELNNLIMGIKNQEYILVAARPSMGKTSLTIKMFLEALEEDKGIPVFFSLEMPTEQIMGRLIALKANLSLKETIFGEPLTEERLKRFQEAKEWLSNKKFVIEDFSKEKEREGLLITPNDIDRRLSRIESNYGDIGVVFIDFIQLLAPNDFRIREQNAKMTHISAMIKALTKKYNTPIVALSQLNRALESRIDKRPLMSDLRESGSLEQDADIIIFVYRAEIYLERELKNKLKNEPDPEIEGKLKFLKERPYTEAELIVGKNRNGPTGIANTFFTKEDAGFKDITPTKEYSIDNIFTQNLELSDLELKDDEGIF